MFRDRAMFIDKVMLVIRFCLVIGLCLWIMLCLVIGLRLGMRICYNLICCNISFHLLYYQDHHLNMGNIEFNSIYSSFSSKC